MPKTAENKKIWQYLVVDKINYHNFKKSGLPNFRQKRTGIKQS